MRAPGAIFNTHIKSVKGMISKGSIIPKKARVDIRFTSDTHETLSLECEGVQIAVPFEKVMELVEETRADRNAVN